MGGLEAVLTGLRDETRHILVKYKYGRELLTLGVCLVAFVFSLQNITYVSTVQMRIDSSCHFVSCNILGFDFDEVICKLNTHDSYYLA